MKIGILTHPQHINYGGILQCYALSTFLLSLGHEVIVIRRIRNETPQWKKLIHSVIKPFRFRKQKTSSTLDKAINIDSFSKKYLNRTESINSFSAMNQVCKDYDLDAVIVGSDQVWRADFALNYGFNYFLDFVPDNVKKLAYAASMGLSEWNYSDKQTLYIKKLLLRFKDISVREQDGVRLCHEYLGLDVQIMPDPTLLLTTTEYDNLVSPRLIKDKYVFVYWLGDKSFIEPTISEYKSKAYKVIYIGLREQRELPSVEDWLSYIRYAEVVVTDSFHGCVFSILYHRHLDIYGNKSGGYGRIISLLDSFGLSKEDLLGNYYNLQVEGVFLEIRKKAKLFINNSLQ